MLSINTENRIKVWAIIFNQKFAFDDSIINELLMSFSHLDIVQDQLFYPIFDVFKLFDNFGKKYISISPVMNFPLLTMADITSNFFSHTLYSNESKSFPLLITEPQLSYNSVFDKYDLNYLNKIINYSNDNAIKYNDKLKLLFIFDTYCPVPGDEDDTSYIDDEVNIYNSYNEAGYPFCIRTPTLASKISFAHQEKHEFSNFPLLLKFIDGVGP